MVLQCLLVAVSGQFSIFSVMGLLFESRVVYVITVVWSGILDLWLLSYVCSVGPLCVCICRCG